jgi:hypothetical protein
MASSSSDTGETPPTNGIRPKSTAEIGHKLEELANHDAASTNGIKGILGFPTEILSNILAHIDQDANVLVKCDRRAYLSQESFRAPEHNENQRKDVENFRLTCRLFADVGVEHQFTRVTLRFNEEDFRRLQGIASYPKLALCVRKFSYMVPCGFYHEKGLTKSRLSRSIAD